MDMTVGKRMRDELATRRRQAVVVSVNRAPSRQELDVMTRQARRLGVRIIFPPPVGGKP